MTSKHFGWHRRWQLDLAAGRATHDTGLIATYSTHTRGHPVATLSDPNNVTPALQAKHGGHNLPQMLARLQREALDLRAFAIQRENRRA